MALGKKQIEAQLEHLGTKEELSDLWSDSDASDDPDYRKNDIRIDMDNRILTSLHTALKHDESDEPLIFKHDKLERANKKQRHETMAKTLINWFDKD